MIFLHRDTKWTASGPNWKTCAWVSSWTRSRAPASKCVTSVRKPHTALNYAHTMPSECRSQRVCCWKRREVGQPNRLAYPFIEPATCPATHHHQPAPIQWLCQRFSRCCCVCVLVSCFRIILYHTSNHFELPVKASKFNSVFCSFFFVFSFFNSYFHFIFIHHQYTRKKLHHITFLLWNKNCILLLLSRVK